MIQRFGLQAAGSFTTRRKLPQLVEERFKQVVWPLHYVVTRLPTRSGIIQTLVASGGITLHIHWPVRIRSNNRWRASVDMPRWGIVAKETPNLGACSCKKLICSKYRRHQAQITKCSR